MKRSKRDRLTAFRKGHFAEYVAAFWLFLRGYRIRHLRYRTPSGEIDLIATKGDLAIFVEVKARKTQQSGINAVTFHAQKRIRAASDLWLARQSNAHKLSQRYDIIVISPWCWPAHFLDAF